MSLIRGTNEKITELYYVNSEGQCLSLSKLFCGDKLIWGGKESTITTNSLLSLDGLVLLSNDGLILTSNDNG